ncbi:sigma factor-like helix-turn-helix DNA-binding protein [Sphingosinicella sp. CPCC 101087]|uniref:sigma factor-like helix-turn-helix DNA-binding protein n=1 Tax=Sphingosinicella sp. CPCC 101087 TaxID=2497754 RepID=UPI00101D06C5|nr:sigma factor-like helix-turn-helix DNA-binding protein [Sphingosinicella sp. CPCC 101087]
MSRGADCRRLVRALAELEPRTREIFLMNAADGLSYAEIAARLDITTDDVERHVADALIELDRRMERRWWHLWR